MNDTLNKVSSEEQENQDHWAKKKEIDKVLCEYCGRSDKNGIRCIGKCVADNNY